jgi:hypothetical protein
MHSRERPQRRNCIIGAFLAAAGLLVIGFAFFPTVYATDTFPVPPGALPQEYEIEVRHPTFGPADATAEVTVRLKPREAQTDSSAAAEPYGTVIAEPQSVDVDFDPAGRIQTPLAAGRPVSFSWKAAGTQAGERAYSIFLFLPEYARSDAASGRPPSWAYTFVWRTFTGYGNWKIIILFTATLGFLSGFGVLLGNAIR